MVSWVRKPKNELDPSLKGVRWKESEWVVKSIKEITKKYLQHDELGFTKQILPRFQISIPYINENDYILFLRNGFAKNDVNLYGN